MQTEIRRGDAETVKNQTDVSKRYVSKAGVL